MILRRPSADAAALPKGARSRLLGTGALIRTATGRLRRRLRREEIGLTIVLALQGATIFIVAPLASLGVITSGGVDLCRFFLATAAVLLVTRTRTSALLVFSTFLISLAVSGALRSGPGDVASHLIRISVTSFFDLLIAAVVARAAFGPGRVTVHRILGGVILYLSIGIIFAGLYRAAALTLNPSFSGLPQNQRAALGQLLYFSLSTLTTTGFGDIAPLHPFVRSLANLEAVLGQLYPATLLARLVTLHASGAEAARRAP